VTTLLLVRHAAHDWLGRGIPGRLPGVALNDEGRGQARELAERLSALRVDAIYSSPQQRARETIRPLANRLSLPMGTADEFDEVDFGDWTGRSFAQLEADDAARWRQWIGQRSQAQAPGGEAFAAVGQRVWAGIGRLRDAHPGRTVLVASHGDVIKAALARVLGLSLDNLERLDIAPASLSMLGAAGEGWQVRRVNQPLTGPLLPP
jgi:broad specificity phosphatase PhoE